MPYPVTPLNHYGITCVVVSRMTGVPTPYMIMCLELSLDPDVDLVIMEYTLNDGLDSVLFGNRVVQDMERLVRRVLALPSRPAVVLLQVRVLGRNAGTLLGGLLVWRLGG